MSPRSPELSWGEPCNRGRSMEAGQVCVGQGQTENQHPCYGLITDSTNTAHHQCNTHISKALVPLALEVQLFKGVLTARQHHVHQDPKGEHVCLCKAAQHPTVKHITAPHTFSIPNGNTSQHPTLSASQRKTHHSTPHFQHPKVKHTSAGKPQPSSYCSRNPLLQ